MTINYKVLNKEPDQLGDILNILTKTYSPEDLKDIRHNRDLYATNGLNGEKSIIFDYQANLHKGKPNIHNAYLGFMGICFYYFDKKLGNAAWYYFSKAEYFKGMHDSWDEASKQKEMAELLKKSKKDSAKKLDFLDLEISELLQAIIPDPKRKPNSGWIDIPSLLDETKEDIRKIIKDSNSHASYTDGAIKRRIYKLLREDEKFNEIFKRHK